MLVNKNDNRNCLLSVAKYIINFTSSLALGNSAFFEVNSRYILASLVSIHHQLEKERREADAIVEMLDGYFTAAKQALKHVLNIIKD